MYVCLCMIVYVCMFMYDCLCMIVYVCMHVYVRMFMYVCMFMHVWTLHECIILSFQNFMLLKNSVVRVVFEKSNIAQATNTNPIKF